DQSGVMNEVSARRRSDRMTAASARATNDRHDDTGPMVAGKEPAIGEDEQGCELRVRGRTCPAMHNYRGNPGHPARSAIIGSMREARRAGSQLARSASAKIAAEVAACVATSVGATPYNSEPRSEERRVGKECRGRGAWSVERE